MKVSPTAFRDLPSIVLHGRALADSEARGRRYFMNGRVRTVQIGPEEAQFYVQGSQPEPYLVNAWIVDGEVRMDCTCIYGRYYTETICKHKVAASMALSQWLNANGSSTWQPRLEQALRAGFVPRGRPKARNRLLVFSLRWAYNRWQLAPLSLTADALDAYDADDIEGIAQALATETFDKELIDLKAAFDRSSFRNLTPNLEAVARLCLNAEEPRHRYASMESSIPNLLPLLKGGPLWVGTNVEPLKERYDVDDEPARAELQIDDVDDGIALTPVLRHRGETVPFTSNDVAVFFSDPLWIGYRGRIVRVVGSDPTFAALAAGEPLKIPPSDRDTFYDRHLSPLAERVSLTGNQTEIAEVGGEPTPRLYLSEESSTLRVQLRFGYGDVETVFDPVGTQSSIRRGANGRLLRVRRDMEAEAEFAKLLGAHGLKKSQDGVRFDLRGRTDAIDFLIHQIPRLLEAGFAVYGEEDLKSVRINRSRPSFQFSVSSGIDWFDVHAVARFGDTGVSLKELRQAVRRNERYVKLADGSIGTIPDEWLERYRHLFQFGEADDDTIRLATHHIPLLDTLIADADDVDLTPEFEERRERLANFDKIAPQALPKGLTAELRPYQKAGYDWLHFLHDYGFGGCLADDMGIGKTIQALSFLLSLKERKEAEGATLVVMPRSLLFNWEREVEKFTPGLKLLTHSEQQRTRNPEEFDQYDLVLTTYGVMLRDIEMLRGYRFHYVVLDESQAIKNPQSQTARAARLLKADHRLALTGTPVENSTMELWSQFAFLTPGLLGTQDEFRDQFAGAIEKGQDAAAADLLRKMVFPFILRRTKDQVARELPPRTERILYSDMDEDQKALYDSTKERYRQELMGLIDRQGMQNARMKVLEGLLRLRQIANHPRLVEPKTMTGSGKFESLIETLETLAAEGHKALVFSQFVQMLKIVRQELDERQVPYVYLDGRTKDREERVDLFQSAPEIPFFLISLRAGGVGLNLTAADYVIHIDPWWNPAVERQATDRTHRIGQDKPVFVYKLISRGTVEEKILELQDRKRALADQLVATEAGFFKSLTKDDVGVLFE